MGKKLSHLFDRAQTAAGDAYRGTLREYQFARAVEYYNLSQGDYVNAQVTRDHIKGSLRPRLDINNYSGPEVRADTLWQSAAADVGEATFDGFSSLGIGSAGAAAAFAGQGFGGRKLGEDEKVAIFESSQGSGTYKTWESGERGGISAQSLDVAGTPEQAYTDAFGRDPKPGEPYWETTGGSIASARRFAYNDAIGSPGHVGIFGDRWDPPKWFTRIWEMKVFK